MATMTAAIAHEPDTAIAQSSSLLATVSVPPLLEAFKLLSKALPKKASNPLGVSATISVSKGGQLDLLFCNGDLTIMKSIATQTYATGSAIVPVQLTMKWIEKCGFDRLNLELIEGQDDSTDLRLSSLDGRSTLRLTGLPIEHGGNLNTSIRPDTLLWLSAAQLRAAITRLKRHTYKGQLMPGYAYARGIWAIATGTRQLRLYGTDMSELGMVTLEMERPCRIRQHLPLAIFDLIPEKAQGTVLLSINAEGAETPCGLQWEGVTAIGLTHEDDTRFQWPDLSGDRPFTQIEASWLAKLAATASQYAGRSKIAPLRIKVNMLSQQIQIAGNWAEGAIAESIEANIPATFDILIDAHRLKKILQKCKKTVGLALEMHQCKQGSLPGLLISTGDRERILLMGLYWDKKDGPHIRLPEDQEPTATFQITWQGDRCTLQGSKAHWQLNPNPELAAALRAKTREGAIALTKAEAKSLYRQRVTCNSGV